ncbi:Zinc-specific metallo-regulatory protein [Urinicoccus massiliensis]|uniref:Zinc-specific metallo-regulatory protein n=1 Tax=Urinicoccus massiliensis TaxID=1723382 RepID=A0A8H2MEF1_9FIRM|nr:Fur family transcriptional regulator [Urinicoccus massiliensis]VFB16160.1 Zinc-specific metallo-regulatory protein [Urinicoccus massiliensis]
MTENLLENLLRKNGLKVTKGRKEVLRLMEKRKDEPMKAEQVYDLVPREICSSLSTVYRILNQLSQKGLLKSTLYQNGIMYYQYNSGEHRHYIVCSKCGKVAALENCPMDAFDNYIRKDTGFDITGHVFELTGLCPDCKEKLKSGK